RRERQSGAEPSMPRKRSPVRLFLRETIMATDTIPRTKKHNLIASDRVEGTAVRRPKGDKIGSIERLMIDKVSGKVAYAVLSFGGFLGIGHKHLPIPWSLLNYNVELDAYELDIADDVLRKAPSSEQTSEFDFGDRVE